MCITTIRSDLKKSLIRGRRRPSDLKKVLVHSGGRGPHLLRLLPKVHHILARVREQLLAKALEVAVDERQHAAARVARHKLPGQQPALDGRELALAQVQVVVALPQVPPGGRGMTRIRAL